MSVSSNMSSSASKIVFSEIEIRPLTSRKGETFGHSSSAPSYSFVPNQSSSVAPSTYLRDASPNATPSVVTEQDSHTVTYAFVIVGTLLIVAAIVSLVGLIVQ